jgi:hypothetical protein
MARMTNEQWVKILNDVKHGAWLYPKMEISELLATM